MSGPIACERTRLICHTLPNHTEVPELLVQRSKEYKIDLNAKTTFYDMTAFHICCNNRDLKLAKMLIQNSTKFHIDLNAKNHVGWTGFHYACKNEWNFDLGRFIVENSIEFKG